MKGGTLFARGAGGSRKPGRGRASRLQPVPGAQSQFACYENLSRAPKAELEESAKPAAAKSASRTRKTGANGIIPVARRLP